MDSLKDIRSVEVEGQKWLSVMDIANKIGRDNAGLRQQIIKLNVVLKTIYYFREGRGKKTLLFINGQDVPKVLASLRVTGEFADSFKQIKDNVMSRGLETIKPQRQIKHFQRFPDPIKIPGKPIRASVVEFVRKVAIVLKVDTSLIFKQLYTEFKYRFSIDLARHAGYKTGIDKCVECEKVQELYSLAREMYDEYIPTEKEFPELEDDYEKLPTACN